MSTPEESLAMAKDMDAITGDAPRSAAAEYARLAMFWRSLAERAAQHGDLDRG
jgi:hypothetical protein